MSTIRTMPTKTVAVIGASSNRSKFGNKALRAYERQGYTVLAINPNEREVEGHTTYASVLDVPGPIDIATVYVPPEIGVMVMEELAKKQMPEVWLNPGADGPRWSRVPASWASRPSRRAQHHCDWGEPVLSGTGAQINAFWPLGNPDS